MLIGFWHSQENFNLQKDILSNPKELTLGEDPLIPLKHLFDKINFKHKIEFINFHKISDYDAFIFFNYPKSKKLIKLIKEDRRSMYLICSESPTIDDSTWNIQNHVDFEKIFTWDDKSVDNIKYFKINHPTYHKIKNSINKKIKRNFCIMINSNKSNNHRNDLYKERRNIINWFEKNNPDKFDLYGYGWDYQLEFKGSKYLKNLFKLKYINKLLTPNLNTFKGEFNGLKQNLLEDYKFCICFENAKNYSGLVTEKIFHCFFAGCIPIYYGAENISDLIGFDCYIDYRNFKKPDLMYNYLINLSDIKIQKYIENIKLFLQSEKFDNFEIKSFVNTIYGEIVE